MTASHRHRLWTGSTLTAAALVAGCWAPVVATAAPARLAAPVTHAPAAVHPDLTRARPARACRGTRPPRRWDHVVWIVMENQSPAGILGSRAAPFENALARQCAQAATYYAVTHPSLPNYLALTSGSTHGVTNDAAPSVHPVPGASIFTVLAAARTGWATFAESMPTPCDRASGGRYAVKHNPAAYYTALRSACARYDLPMGTPHGGALANALARRTLPAFTLLVPNLCHDDHSCPVSTGDAWLRTWVAKIVASPTYRAGSTAVFITWDENDGRAGNRVALLAVAPSIRPGLLARGRFGHLALLHTTLLMLGLRDPLTPRQPSMRGALRL